MTDIKPSSLTLWAVEDKSGSLLEASCTSFNQVRDIYQGEMLLVLHWVKPKNGYGYWFRSRTTIVHLLCRDDVKLCAKSEQQS